MSTLGNRVPHIVRVGFAVVLLIALATTAAASVTLQIEPSSVSVAPGATTLISVTISDVVAPGLAAFQFNLVFDPDVVNLLDPNAAGPDPPFAPSSNWMLTSTGRSAVGTNAIDNATGVVTVAYGTTPGGALPTGDGTIAVIKVKGVATGSSPLTLSNVILADAGEPPQPFSATLVPGAVTVGVGDTDDDGVPDDGDGSGDPTDHPCAPGASVGCDDNCRYRSNPDQADANGDGVGDVCTCGDMNGNGLVDGADLTLYKRYFGGLSSPFSTDRCGVSPAPDGGACNGADLTVIKRYFGGLPPGITNTCSAYVGP
jgi:hypothetical protein